MTLNPSNLRIIHDVPVSPQSDVVPGLGRSAYPVSTRHNEGLISCAYRTGSAQHSADGIGVVQTSTDQGRTWSPPVIVFDGRDLSPPESLVSPQIVAPRDGSLLTLFPVTITTHPGHDIVDTEEGLAQRRRYYKSHSVDGGRTWDRSQK